MGIIKLKKIWLVYAVVNQEDSISVNLNITVVTIGTENVQYHSHT